MARQAAKGDLLNVGYLFEFRQLLEQFAVLQAFPGFDVPGEIEPVFADRVNGAAGQDERDSGLVGHENPSLLSRCMDYRFYLSRQTTSSHSGGETVSIVPIVERFQSS
jgi:hypothetical protein